MNLLALFYYLNFRQTKAELCQILFLAWALKLKTKQNEKIENNDGQESDWRPSRKIKFRKGSSFWLVEVREFTEKKVNDEVHGWPPEVKQTGIVQIYIHARPQERQT